MKKLFLLAFAAGGALLVLPAQDAILRIEGEGRPNVAIPDFRGDAQAQPFMGVLNQTLWGDLAGAGLFKLVPKTMYPTTVPQQPADFRQRPTVVEQPQKQPRGRHQPPVPVPQTGGGLWMSDWSSPPASANYLAIGYAGVQIDPVTKTAKNGVFVLRGWFLNLSRDTPAAAQVIGKFYTGSVDEDGARKTAHEFAADILALFGGKSLFGTHIYFVSNRTGRREIWVMDPDGRNQRQITRFNAVSIQPAVSPDGSKVAFTSYAKGTPGIFMFSVDPVRDLHFYNQAASVNETPSFTPDGKQIVYASSAGGRCCRIFIANLDGSGFRPITSSSFIDVEPKVNPKTGSEIAFVSGRSGPQQIYRMNMDGGDIERISEGTGEASNPAWNPEGQILAFSWTRGFATGNWNLFIMDVASRKYNQLTHGEGRNEHPSWAPDGTHLAFDSTRTGRTQIYTMLGDGTGVQPLTSLGENWTPSWGK